MIPPYKKKNVNYEIDLLVEDDEWISEIVKNIKLHSLEQERATLVICDTVEDLLDIEAKLKKEQIDHAITYKDESVIRNELNPSMSQTKNYGFSNKYWR